MKPVMTGAIFMPNDKVVLVVEDDLRFGKIIDRKST